MTGHPVTGNQTKLWKASCSILSANLLSNDCHMFYSRIELATAVCCKVSAQNKIGALCLLLELFQYGNGNAKVMTVERNAVDEKLSKLRMAYTSSSRAWRGVISFLNPKEYIDPTVSYRHEQTS